MSETVLSPGLQAVRAASARLGVHLAELVAEVGLWVPPAIQARYVRADNPAGAVYPQVRRARMGSGERPGAVIDGLRLDRNNYAGAAIREALGGRGKAVAGYQACHVWPETCYDPRYHTALANLVLVPSPLVSLTDHDPDVIAALKFRAFELYGWHPTEEAAPSRPPRYPTNWRAPEVTQRAPRRTMVGEPAPPHAPAGGEGERQRDVMLRLWKRHNGERDAILRDAAAALRCGEMRWRSNRRGMKPEEYAYRLWLDGTTKGWLS